MKRWDTFINNNSFKGTYAKTGAKLIKKHSNGGWIDQNKGIWDYTDGPKDIQKKIARYYATLNQDDNDDLQVTNYLKQHKDLAEYLDTIYKKGINWDEQKALGNTPTQPWQFFKNSQGNIDYTEKMPEEARQSYVKAMGYNNLEDFNNTLRDAGYDVYKGFVEKDGNQYFLTPEVLKNKRGLFGPDGRILTVNANALKPIAKQHQRYLNSQAKKDALRSKASFNWYRVASFLNMKGHFYDQMINAGYKYDSDKGVYTKDGNTYSVDNQGNVFKNRNKIPSKNLFK